MNLNLTSTATPTSRRANPEPDWQRHLPEEWRSAVVHPLHFGLWREYEMPASRCLGYDENDQPCFYRHRFLLDALRLGDGDELYAAIIYSEEVIAWRLRDERWLIWRVVQQEDDRHEGRGFYSFAEQMPR